MIICLASPYKVSVGQLADTHNANHPMKRKEEEMKGKTTHILTGALALMSVLLATTTVSAEAPLRHLAASEAASHNWPNLENGFAATPPEVRTIPKEDWLPRLQRLFASANLRINNYTPTIHQYNRTGERAFFRPNDSFFSIRSEGRDVRFPLSIDMIEAGPDNRCKTYLNDWNSRSITVAPVRGMLRVRLDFEDRGVEIVTNCYNNFCCEGNPFCPGAGCPDYDLSRPVATIDLSFRIARGRLTYEAATRFAATVSEGGDDICVENAWAFLCDWGTVPRRSQRQNRVREAIENQLQRQIDSPRLRGLLEGALATTVPVDGYSRIRISHAGDIILQR